MKKLLAIAAFLLASTAAQAQYTFEYGGRTIRIDPDRGTVSIPGVYDNTGRRAKRSHNDQDGDRSRKPPPQQVKVDPAPAANPQLPHRRPHPAHLQPPLRPSHLPMPPFRRRLYPRKRRRPPRRFSRTLLRSPPSPQPPR